MPLCNPSISVRKDCSLVECIAFSGLSIVFITLGSNNRLEQRGFMSFERWKSEFVDIHQISGGPSRLEHQVEKKGSSWKAESHK